MKKKSIFKASFEESLNLLDDGPLQYSKKEYYEHLGKELNNGIPSIGFRIKNILFSIFFVFGGNFLLAVFANSLNNADPKDLTLPIYKPQLLTPEIFLIGSFIWLVLIIVGKIFREPFIRPYRHRFHILTYLIWLGMEFNLLGITVALPTLTLVGVAGIYFLLFILALLFIRTERRILKNRFFGEVSENTLVDRVRFYCLVWFWSIRDCCNFKDNFIQYWNSCFASFNFIRIIVGMVRLGYSSFGNDCIYGVSFLFRRLLQMEIS